MKNIFRIKKLCVASFLLLLLICMPESPIQAQGASYSQFFNNPVYYNPALTGQYLGMRMRLNYRKQWNGLPNNYNNFSFGMDVAERNYPGAGGIGLLAQHDFDGIGNVRTKSVALTNAVRIPIGDDIITHFGVSLAYVEKLVDYENFVFSGQLNPTLPNNFDPSYFADWEDVRYPDLNFGIMLQVFEQSRSFNSIVGTFSAAMHHAFRPNVSFTANVSRLEHKYVFMGDLLLDNETLFNRRRSRDEFFYKLNPGFLYEMQGDLSNFVIGANVYKSNLYGGMWLRSQDFIYTQVNDLIMLIGFYKSLGDSFHLKFMYSYDFVISDARRAVGSTHEWTLTFEFDSFSIFGASNVRPGSRAGCPHCPPF